MRRLASFVLCLACAAVARAQTPPAAAEPPAAPSGSQAPAAPAAAEPPEAPAAPAPAAYQPAVLGPAEAPPPPAAPAEAPTAPAAASGRQFPRYAPGRQLSPEERAQLVEARAALLRDRRGQGKPQRREEDEPVRHGDPRARWTLAISLDSVFYTDHGYDYFDDNNVAQRLGLWAGFDFAQLDPRTSLAVELGAGAESQEQGVWNGALNTKLESQTASVGLSLRHALLTWLDPQVRVSGGATRFEFQLDTSDDETYDDSAISGFGALSAGLLFHTPSGTFENRRGQFASFGFGLLVEGGYALRQSVELTPERGAPKHAIPITQAGLGELALSGPYVRTSVLVRF